MNYRSRATILITSALLTCNIVWAYSAGPPNGLTGGPNEGTCAAIGCHSSLNTGSGSVSVAAPSEYIPGDTIDIIVNLQMLEQSRWGFELTVLDSLNQPAGNLIVTDATRMQLSSLPTGRQYIKHRSFGTDPGTFDAAPGWAFKFESPSEGTGPVTFWFAGNAANNNNVNTGDFIYTSSRIINEASLTDVNELFASTLPSHFTLSQNYPNPFNPTTTIAFNLPSATQIRLDIYNVTGQIVRNLMRRKYLAGEHIVEWDGNDNSNNPVSTGIYFYRLASDEQVETRKMVLIK